MREPDNIRAVEVLDIDMMGFIFYPRSPRFVDRVPEYLPDRAKRVGVFVNEEPQSVLARVNSFGLDFVQLHGDESVEQCRILRDSGCKVIKAFSISDARDLLNTQEYDGVCDYFVFDTRTPSVGGSGEHFDWSLLANYRGCTPFLLSGGIGAEDVAELNNFTHPMLAGYDLNSRFETAAAVKDPRKIEQFLEQIKHSKYE